MKLVSYTKKVPQPVGVEPKHLDIPERDFPPIDVPMPDVEVEPARPQHTPEILQVVAREFEMHEPEALQVVAMRPVDATRS